MGWTGPSLPAGDPPRLAPPFPASILDPNSDLDPDPDLDPAHPPDPDLDPAHPPDSTLSVTLTLPQSMTLNLPLTLTSPLPSCTSGSRFPPLLSSAAPSPGGDAFTFLVASVDDLIPT